MDYSPISKLAEYFEKLPGIGPRQASRFVYSLLNRDEEFLKKFGSLIAGLKQGTAQCPSCQRFFADAGKNKECVICRSAGREKSLLLVAEKDVDLQNIEKAGFYNGMYFVLGGLVPALGEKLPKEIKIKEFFERIKKDASLGVLREIILALNATLEGDSTCRYIEKIIEPILEKIPIKIGRLGRGLSTGTELEYSDKETILHALKNRK